MQENNKGRKKLSNDSKTSYILSIAIVLFIVNLFSIIVLGFRTYTFFGIIGSLVLYTMTVPVLTIPYLTYKKEYINKKQDSIIFCLPFIFLSGVAYYHLGDNAPILIFNQLLLFIGVIAVFFIDEKL